MPTPERLDDIRAWQRSARKTVMMNPCDPECSPDIYEDSRAALGADYLDELMLELVRLQDRAVKAEEKRDKFLDRLNSIRSWAEWLGFYGDRLAEVVMEFDISQETSLEKALADWVEARNRCDPGSQP